MATDINKAHYEELLHTLQRAELNFKQLMSRSDRRSDNSYKTVKGALTKTTSYKPEDLDKIVFNRNELRIMIELCKTVLTALATVTIPTYEDRIKKAEFDTVKDHYKNYLTECTNRISINKGLIKYFESKL